jgi:hypothetical protein
MKVDTKDIRGFADDLVKKCTISQATRASQYGVYRKYFFDGAGYTDNGPIVADYNKINSHIDELASYLFSPDELRFLIEATRNANPKLLSQYETASSFLTRQFHLRDCDLSIGRGMVWALVYGSCFPKYVWNAPRKIRTEDDLPVFPVEGEIDPYLVMPYQLGVMREDINGLDRQEAIVQTNYILIDELDRQLKDHPKYKDIMAEVRAAKELNAGDPKDMAHSVFVGENYPIVTSGNPQNGGGQVMVQSNMPQIAMSPDVVARMVKTNEIWVWDDEMDDYTTIINVDGGPIIEGELKRRNLNVPGEHPYGQLCPNEIEGYIWGVSEIAMISRLQERLNQRMQDMNDLIDRKVDTARAFIGFSGIDEEKAMTLNTPGGWIAEQDPGGKIETINPDIPKELVEDIEMVQQMFSDQGGLSSILQGQGESGVRSAQHAETLVRTSSPRLRDRSLLIERQVAVCGDKVFKLLQEKIADQFTTKDNQTFTLSQIDGDYKMTVDSHSSSPVFSKEAKDTTLLLAKLGVIDGESILDLLQPPLLDTLKARLRQKQEAQAKMLKEHPELAVEGGAGKKKKGIFGK